MREDFELAWARIEHDSCTTIFAPTYHTSNDNDRARVKSVCHLFYLLGVMNASNISEPMAYDPGDVRRYGAKPDANLCDELVTSDSGNLACNLPRGHAGLHRRVTMLSGGQLP